MMRPGPFTPDSLGGLDPQLVAEIQRLMGPQETIGAPSLMTRSIAGPAPAMPPAAPPDEESDAWDMFTGIISSPFRLLGAAKRGLEDAVGHPNAIARDQMEAQQDATLRYLLASQSIPDDVKALLPGYVPPPDRTGITARQISTSGTATGRDNSMLPVPKARKTGTLEWLTGEDRRQKAREQATIQVALKLAGYDADMQQTQAQTFQARAGGMSNLAETRKKLIEADILEKHGYAEAAAKVRAELARGTAHLAQAGESNAGRSLKLGQLDEVQAEGRRNQMMFDDVTYPSGVEDLRQSRIMGPIKAEKDLAYIRQKDGSGGAGSKDQINAAKGLTTALAAANEPAGRWPWSGTVGDPEAVLNIFDVPRFPEGSENAGEPDYGTWTKSFRPAAQPGAPSRALDGLDAFGVPRGPDGQPDFETYVDRLHSEQKQKTISTRPTGAEKYQLYDLLKKHLPGLDDGVINQRAELIAEAMPSLDFTTEDAFIDSAELAGLNDEEIVLLWNSRNR